MTAASAGKMESYKELTKDPADSYQVWERELNASAKHYETYHQISDTILKRYRDERKELAERYQHCVEIFKAVGALDDDEDNQIEPQEKRSARGGELWRG